ncbi:MAG: polysaccharide biosynthesis protein, partial [Lysobacter sp.]
PKILQAEPREVSSLQIEHAIAQLREATASYDREALAMELRNAVPEFQPIGQHLFSQASSTVVAFPARNARKI